MKVNVIVPLPPLQALQVYNVKRFNVIDHRFQCYVQK